MLEQNVLDPIVRLTRDLKSAAATLSPDEARFLVDYYYIMQKQRIRTANQIRAMSEDEEPHEVISWLSSNTAVIERNIKSALQVYAQSKEIGEWAMSNKGIGPIIASGLIAHVDIEKTPSISALWSFAGLNPAAVWNKKQKRPWNARLKVICWHAGECFKRISGDPESLYGRLYRERKEFEVARSNAGQCKAVAEKTLADKKFKSSETLNWYKQGKLPPGRLDLRATRHATKLFLSHFWQVLYEIHYKKKPPAPWIIQHGGHIDLIPIPNWN